MTVTSVPSPGEGASRQPSGLGPASGPPPERAVLAGVQVRRITGVGATPGAARLLQAFTVELEPALLPDLVRAGSGPGRRLWSRGAETLLGIGEAMVLPLLPGWSDGSQARAIGEVLSEIEDLPPQFTSVSVGDSTLPRATSPTRALAHGPIAMGALPYDPASAGALCVPHLLLRKAHGTAFATAVVRREDRLTEQDIRDYVAHQLAVLRSQASAGPAPDEFELVASMSHDDWMGLVTRTVAEIASGALRKVVLARKVDVKANRPFVVPEILGRLASLYPSCTIFHVEGFIGASPETLVRRVGLDVLSHPLAGTVARSGDAASDDALLASLMASAKDRREHRLVVEAISRKLAPLCTELRIPASPSPVFLRNVCHLGTALTGSLAPRRPAHFRSGPLGTVPFDAHLFSEETFGPGHSEPGHSEPGHSEPAHWEPAHWEPAHWGPEPSRASTSAPSALELASILQPTPAVGGEPTEAALRWQRANEGFDRGQYAGPVGWVDSRGDGEWALGLRSAYVNGAQASLFAGSGIVDGSNPASELAETQLKLQALLAAVVRP